MKKRIVWSYLINILFAYILGISVLLPIYSPDFSNINFRHIFIIGPLVSFILSTIMILVGVRYDMAMSFVNIQFKKSKNIKRKMYLSSAIITVISFYPYYSGSLIDLAIRLLLICYIPCTTMKRKGTIGIHYIVGLKEYEYIQD